MTIIIIRSRHRQANSDPSFCQCRSMPQPQPKAALCNRIGRSVRKKLSCVLARWSLGCPPFPWLGAALTLHPRTGRRRTGHCDGRLLTPPISSPPRSAEPSCGVEASVRYRALLTRASAACFGWSSESWSSSSLDDSPVCRWVGGSANFRQHECLGSF